MFQHRKLVCWEALTPFLLHGCIGSSLLPAQPEPFPKDKKKKKGAGAETIWGSDKVLESGEGTQIKVLLNHLLNEDLTATVAERVKSNVFSPHSSFE